MDKQIDVELQDVVRALNAVGLRTTQCCSGHGGEKKAYLSISLENVEDVGIREKGTRLVIWWDGPKATQEQEGE